MTLSLRAAAKVAQVSPATLRAAAYRQELPAVVRLAATGHPMLPFRFGFDRAHVVAWAARRSAVRPLVVPETDLSPC